MHIFCYRAIEESLALSMQTRAPNTAPVLPEVPRGPDGSVAVPGGLAVTPGGSVMESELAIALSLSQQHQEEEDARRKQEEETLKRILELSLTEK